MTRTFLRGQTYPWAESNRLLLASETSTLDPLSYRGLKGCHVRVGPRGSALVITATWLGAQDSHLPSCPVEQHLVYGQAGLQPRNSQCRRRDSNPQCPKATALQAAEQPLLSTDEGTQVHHSGSRTWHQLLGWPWQTKKHAKENCLYVPRVIDGVRTHDLRDHNPALHQLSYNHHNDLLLPPRPGRPSDSYVPPLEYRCAL